MRPIVVTGLLTLLSLAALATLVTGCASMSPPREAGKQCFHLNAKAEKEIGFCQAVRVGNTLHVSGSVGAGDMPGAIHAAYGTLRKTLSAHGLDFRHVVSETVYATDLDAFIRNKDARKEYYKDDFPAATWVQVPRLYLPAFVVEVQVTAVFPK
jgi:2-iminobutanoate/2-iminopropanoate deaminase